MHEIDRFWYESKNKRNYDALVHAMNEHRARVYLKEFNSRPIPVCPGTQPDIEVRW